MLTNNAIFPNIVVNDLTEFSFNAGSDQTLTFNVFDSGSNAFSLAGATVTWKLAPYGQSTSILTKTGVLSGSPTNQFSVYLDYSDTSDLSGKYAYQYTVVAVSGSYFNPSQGTMYINPRIV